MSRPSRPPTFNNDSAAHEGSGEKLRVPVPPSVESLSRRLLALCAALHFGQTRATEVEAVFRTLVVPWIRLGVRQPSTEATSFASGLGAGNASVEFAATLSPVGSEISVLFEPRGERPSPRGNYAASLAMFAEAARDFGANLGRFEHIADLFFSEQLEQPWTLWSAVAFAPGKRPTFKAYCKPSARAAAQAHGLVEQALRRLGMPHAWAHLAETMMRRGAECDQLEYLAFDLADGPLSNIELCVRHDESTADDHERETHLDGHTPRGVVAPFVRAMAGEGEGTSRRATLTCAAFVAGTTGGPPVTTHYVPVCGFAESDAIVSERVDKYLSASALSAAPYRRALDALIDGPLEANAGRQTWVAVGWCNGVPRFTLRLAAGGGEAVGSVAVRSD